MKSLLAYTAGTFFPRMYTFVALFVFSRLLSVHDFGLYVLVITVGEFCDFTATAWLKTGFLRFYHGGIIKPEEGPKSLTPLFQFFTKGSMAGVALAWPISWVLVRQDWLVFGAMTSLYVLGNGAAQVSLNTLRGEGRPLPFMLIEMTRPLCTLAAGIAAIKLFQPSFLAAGFAAFSCHALIGIFAFARIWWKRRLGEPYPLSVRQLFEYAWPMMFSLVLVAAMNASDRYQLQWWLGPQAVAIYAIAYSIGRQPIDILGNALNMGGFTSLMESYDLAGPAAASKLMGRQVALMLSLTLPAVVGLSLLAPHIIHTLFDHRYWDKTPALVAPIATLALFAGLKSYGFDQGFYMVRRTGLLAIALLPSAIIGIGASAILINLFGLVGAAYGMMLGYAVSLVVSAVLVRRLLPGSLAWREIAKIVVASAIMGLAVRYAPLERLPEAVGLAAGVALGGVIYAASFLGADVLGLRTALADRVRLRTARGVTP